MTDTPDNLMTTPAKPVSAFARLWQEMSPQQLMGVGVAVAAAVALLVGLFMWGQTPDYRVLYSNLSDQDGGAIIESLQQQNIPYKFAEGGGALLVPANLVHETRLRMASQGLPKGGTAGFEIMEAQKFGTSQFLEQVNYQRSLEGELSRSMQTLGAVQNARVHLAIPKPTVFVKEQQKPSASVVLALRPGRTLDPGQVNGIIHLVSSSIPNMPATSVTVLDQSGNLLSANREGADQTMDATQLKYVREIEQDYIKRIEAILIPIAGQQNVKAQVTASIDFSQVEQTAETYKPNQRPNTAAVRSTQTMEAQNGNPNAGGVPGALSNQPPTAATAPITKPTTAQGANAQAAAAAATNANSSTRKEATSNYEVDRTIQHTKLPVGSIRRMSVAVVMNNRNVTDPKTGKVSSKPYTDAEKAQMTSLVKDAMGFDPKRGDSLNLLNSAFNNEQEVIPEVPLWKQPEMIALAKELGKYLLIAAVVGYLLFGVIRPTFRDIAAQAAARAEAEAAAKAAAAEAAKHAHHGAAQYDAQQAENSYEDNLQLAKELTKSDPKIVASVVKEWVNKE
ncbi:MAG: flagellar basal-body MS-ring/collar protein FliF [Gallionellaceae bacterium]|nr:flagellar basal-body MS-ring/collar protein FliF [Gallionellaceae bacterium]